MSQFELDSLDESENEPETPKEPPSSAKEGPSAIPAQELPTAAPIAASPSLTAASGDKKRPAKDKPKKEGPGRKRNKLRIVDYLWTS